MDSNKAFEIAGKYADEILAEAKRPLEAIQIANHVKFLIEQFITDRMIEKRVRESREEVKIQSHKRF